MSLYPDGFLEICKNKKKYFFYFLFSKKSFENKKSFLENYLIISLKFTPHV